MVSSKYSTSLRYDVLVLDLSLPYSKIDTRTLSIYCRLVSADARAEASTAEAVRWRAEAARAAADIAVAAVRPGRAAQFLREKQAEIEKHLAEIKTLQVHLYT